MLTAVLSAVVGMAGGGLWAATNWPRINDVETGKSPEYPDIQVQTYSASPERVGKALDAALYQRPGWTVVGSGQGPAGMALTAVHETRYLRFKDDVTVKISRQSVTVKSASSLVRMIPAAFTR